MSKDNKNKKSCPYVAVGGQALIEGIMMRGPKGTAMSCRMPDGRIETEMKDFPSIRKKYKFFNIPFIRGVVAFIESMIMGYKLLMESAEKTALDIEEDAGDSKLDKWLSEHFGPKMMAVIGTIASVLGFGLAFVLFIWLPSFLFDKLVLGNIVQTTTFRPLFEGVLRIIIFVFYMFITSKMKDIHRVYMYHGAEHKTIFCFEHGKKLTPANVMKEKRFHPRCGTSFIFVTIILSILISSAVAIIWSGLTQIRALWIVVKLLLLPLIMGIGFEFIQLAGKYPNKFTMALSAPGLAMQRITTAEPDEKICEVAIAALKAALSGEVPEEEMPVNKDDDAQGEEAAETETAEEETAAEETEETAETVSAGAESPREDPADEES
ncbi:MAG: DUF1385 domain-containing protein [Clostridia bacterium]|nr:DUF1385 domain-containing protein [Clostridia bacterium]